MKVRLKTAWGQWPKGHVFTDMPGGQARTLIARNIAETVDAAPAPGQASLLPGGVYADRQMTARKRRA